MRGALKVGTFFKIPVFIHWTFGFILLFIGVISYRESFSVDQTLWLYLIFASVFFCVILHEYGHALCARHYGIRTQDIILTPIGGIARLMGMPKKPSQELLVAIAGPLVNVAIAILLLPFLYFLPSNALDLVVNDNQQLVFSTISYVPILIFLNITLFAFNLIPAFPLDGGRIFRALLAMRLTRSNATLVAARVGQLFALGFIIYGLSEYSFSLALIGGFVLFNAQRELKAVQFDEYISNLTIAELVRRDFTAFHLKQAVGMAFHADAQYPEVTSFIVLNDAQEAVGELKKLGFDAIKNTELRMEPIEQFVHPLTYSVTPEVGIERCLRIMQAGQHTILPVKENGVITGVIDYYAIRKQLLQR